MESTGDGGKIHLSETTAELLETAGKGEWMTKRENQVAAKGKNQNQSAAQGLIPLLTVHDFTSKARAT